MSQKERTGMDMERAPEPGRPLNIFVLGLNDYHRAHLGNMARAQGIDYRFHTLLHMDKLRGVEELPIEALLNEARERLEALDEGAVDAIVTFIDFPAVEIAAILAQEQGTHGPSLESVLRCNHKYWSRLLQQAAVPRHVPNFAAFDPFDDRALDKLDLKFPFWIKPLNGYRSHLGFRINDPDDFQRAIPAFRAHLARLSDPLAEIMAYADLPAGIQALGSTICIAEELIGGRQCTLEGYVHHSEVHVYGVVDSIREANRCSFARYQYPSSFPARLQEEMAEITRDAVAATGLDDSAFNVEFFHDPVRERLWLLEINPRISQSHCELFEKVDGVSHQQVAIDLALGRTPRMPYREGVFPMAAKCFLRAFGDARVGRTPTAADLARVDQEVPGTSVEILVDDVSELSELTDQDSYSYELAWVWLGGENQKDLLARFDKVRELLWFDLQDKDEETATA